MSQSTPSPTGGSDELRLRISQLYAKIKKAKQPQQEGQSPQYGYSLTVIDLLFISVFCNRFYPSTESGVNLAITGIASTSSSERLFRVEKILRALLVEFSDNNQMLSLNIKNKKGTEEAQEEISLYGISLLLKVLYVAIENISTISRLLPTGKSQSLTSLFESALDKAYIKGMYRNL